MRGAGQVAAFDVCGPLPSGVTVLEASAGTGKTFTIAALAARYVAEQAIPLEHLLLVTFTRMATGELRDRVRERLVSAERGLAARLGGVVSGAHDEVVALLASAAPGEVEARRRRLARSLAEFDAATIATTHQFCHHILSSLGVAGDVERDITFVEDVRDLVAEVVDDLYVRRFAHDPGSPPFDLAEARRLAQAVVDRHDADLRPAPGDGHDGPAVRRRFADAVRAEVERRKRRAGLLTYDDLLTRLRDTLADPVRGPAACERLRQRYRVALVDEFQDTDPVQWQIMDLAFGQAGATLVLIGDPKQAIYSFRGADVYAYLDAAGRARRQTLGVNWRSDQGLIDACGAVFGSAPLGHPDITYRPVRATEANQASRLLGAPAPTPLRVRVVHRDDGHVDLTPNDFVSVASARQHIAADLAADVVELLAADAQLVLRTPDGDERDPVEVAPGDVAVLVARHREAGLVRDALADAGVPAVINGAGSVFASPAAREWLHLLDALERPSSPPRARSVALTAFLGWNAERVATADEDAWEDIHARLHRWAHLLRARGVAALRETISAGENLPGRLLAVVDGERHLTDLRHTGELLHTAASVEQLGPTALTAWLRRRIAEADTELHAEERSRRLDSDADAVQVLTIYRSKGLEFPIVYCPYLWDPSWIPRTDPPVYHDPVTGERAIDVGGPESDDFDEHWDRHVAERRGEDLRLAYVALTRARHQAVVWWAAAWQARDSALNRLLFCRNDGGGVPPRGNRPPEDDQALGMLREVAAGVPGCIAVERSTPIGGRWAGPPPRAGALRVEAFDRSLDPHWRRTSYSAITAAAHDARVASEPESSALSDEPEAPAALVVPAASAKEEARLRAVPSPLAAMPAGAAVGTFVHAVLEHTDFTAADLDAELATRVAEQAARRHLDVGETSMVVAGLRAAIGTPLGPSLDEVSLREVGGSDRLDELAFELPLVGGDVPRAAVDTEAIADLLVEALPGDDVLAGYSARLREPALHRELRGYLAGSIDVVVRRRAGDGTPRFVVVDHKTNWLGVDGEPLTAWHYRPAALAEAMARAHYPLQALLYTVALHRYLRWRLPGYAPDRNLAGVAYLFLRGMGGADTPRVDGQPCGVFTWQPPPALVAELSDLFDRGAAA